MTKEEILKIYEELQVPENIIRHMKKVGEFAEELADKFIEKGFKINKKSITDAAKLHDVMRLSDKGHEKKMAEYLESIDEKAVAKLVEKHGFFSISDLENWEEKIMYYSDKRVDEDEIVSLEERFRRGEKRKGPKGNSDTVNKTKDQIRKLEKEIKEVVGD